MQPKPEMLVDKFTEGEIEGVVVRDLRKYQDKRGWLSELFRHDELPEEFYPQMSYISMSLPHVNRGPHEHVEQADFFCFIGPSNFKLRLWDNRPDSETYGHVQTFTLGEDDPKSVLVPPGVVHAYRNVGDAPGIVINFPNRLFMGHKRAKAIDEIRHEDDPETVFRLDD
ncbi:MAG TPA: dTDP-4-dehydrorhamnose 3,5-epimerase family protein [Pyrinomonadaceae bacterium]|jgi:dTDP-4-dehydrorhamnose 3,5-epimerase